MTRLRGRQKEEIIKQGLARVPPAAALTKLPAITSPTAPGVNYVQTEAQSMKTAVDLIRAALTAAGITL